MTFKIISCLLIKKKIVKFQEVLIHTTPVNRLLIKCSISGKEIMQLTVTLLKPREKIFGPTNSLLKKDLLAFNKFHRGRKPLPKVKEKNIKRVINRRLVIQVNTDKLITSLG